MSALDYKVAPQQPGDRSLMGYCPLRGRLVRVTLRKDRLALHKQTHQNYNGGWHQVPCPYGRD